MLKFETSDVLSPIGSGSGYWRYIPTDDGLRFITGYNYEPGMGVVGKVLDRSVIRPALGWATALSFDRLRLWAESDVDPRTSRNRWFLDSGARLFGLMAAAGLLRQAFTQRNATLGVLGTIAGALTFLSPRHSSVPRAGRCLRQSPDDRSARAPSALAGLRGPSQAVLENRQAMETE